jgi:hypothetical protein
MPLLPRALAVLQGLLRESLPLNCYWYGAVIVDGDGTATPKIPHNNLGECALPTLQPPYAIGWQDPAGSPLVGTFGPDNRTIAFTDCSGFVAWVLRSQSPSAYAAISAQVAEISDPVLQEYLTIIDEQHSQNWPSAADYAVLGLHDAHAAAPLQSLGGNAALALAELQPGDIFAWGLAPELHDTGHVVFVQNQPRDKGDGTWSVDVLDASVLKHSNDSRPGGTGVGAGTITVLPGTKGGWLINFDVAAGDQYHQPLYTSALRVAI